MKKLITIGTCELPLDSYVISGTALLGTKGAGKTYAAKGIAEQLLDHEVPIIVFDPIGRWRFMKIAGDDAKKPRGYKVVVAGGEQPDLPLTPASAPEIVRAAIRENIPLVIDLYDRKLSKADWRRVIQSCFRTLLYENKGLRHIFLEETAEFAPQKVMDGETYAEVEKLVRMGGNASLGITLINQRAQEVNKAVLDLCDNLVLMRQRGSHAIDALEKWIDKLDPKSAQTIARAMPTMGAGEAWVFTGSSEAATHVHTAPIRSFHPDRSKPQLTAEAEAARRADPAEFVAKLSGELEKIIAESEANDPKTLKKRIADLEVQLRTVDADDTKSYQARNDGFQEGKEAGAQAASLRYEQLLTTLRSDIERHQRSIYEIGADLRDLKPVTLPELPAVVVTTHPPASSLKPATRQALEQVAHAAVRRPAIRFKPGKNPGGNGAGDVELGSGGKRRILTALAQYPAGLGARKLSILIDMSPKGGTWRTYMTELRGKGWLTGSSDHLAITDAGAAALGSWEPLPTGDELIQYWRRKLGDSGKRAIFDVVVGAHPRAIAQETVSERTNIAIAGGTWRTYMAELRGLGLIEGRGELRASEDLFG